MLKRQVKVGIVGLGANGRGHIQAHIESGVSQIVAIYDRNPALVAQVGGEFGIGRGYTDDSFFDDREIEAVSINTGDADHKAPFLKAVRAGKHVLVEKPVANSEDDVREMVAAAERAGPGLKTQVGYILRFNPVIEEIHRLAADGKLGRVFYMEGDYVHNLLFQAKQTDPVTGRNWYLEGEIPMVGGGSHPLDMLRWVSGKEVRRVWGFSNHVAFPAMRHDDCQVCLFQFEDGTIAKVAALYAPYCSSPPFNNVRIYGTRGTVDRDAAACARNADDVHPPFNPVQGERVTGHSYLPEILDWLEAIIDDRPTRTPLWDGANSTLAALAAVRAMREKREVEVPSFRSPSV
jgi:UDP-N-acetyl-2-amino-2-deoxyglucuronate dehydrogenase